MDSLKAAIIYRTVTIGLSLSLTVPNKIKEMKQHVKKKVWESRVTECDGLQHKAAPLTFSSGALRLLRSSATK